MTVTGFARRLPGVRRFVTLVEYFRFELPRSTTALGLLLLLGVVAIHCFWLSGHSLLTSPPVYLDVYLVVVSALALVAALALAVPRTTGAGWAVGSIVCVISVVGYVVSRAAPPPGLTPLGGRWDYALGTLALALAAAFVAVHATLVTGVNIAYPQHRHWHD